MEDPKLLRCQEMESEVSLSRIPYYIAMSGFCSKSYYGHTIPIVSRQVRAFCAVQQQLFLQLAQSGPHSKFIDEMHERVRRIATNIGGRATGH